jgi:hypothetical protein
MDYWKPIGLSAFDFKRPSCWLFESIWNFGTERFNYFIFDAIILKCPALVS